MKLAMAALGLTLACAAPVGLTAAAAAPAAAPAEVFAAADISDAALVRSLPGFREGFATVDGVRIHYVTGGKGRALVLLPGWPETWWEYNKVMPALAKDHQVIAIDLRGMGQSDKPAGGYDKKTMAADVACVVKSLGFSSADVVGHDIGSQVAFAVAANHPQLTRRLVMVDVPHPDASLAAWNLVPTLGQGGDKVGDGSHAFAWWFAFHQVKGLPEDLLADGRDRLEQDWFFHYLTADEALIDARSRDVYAAAYRSRDAIRAGDAWYQAWGQDMADDKTYGKLQMPVLAIGGPGYGWLASVLPPKVQTLKLVKLEKPTHFVPEEQPDLFVREVETFLK